MLSHVSKIFFTFKLILDCKGAAKPNTKFRYPKNGKIGSSVFRRIKGTTSGLRQAGKKCLTRCAEKDAKAIEVSRRGNKWLCRCYGGPKSSKFSTRDELRRQSMVVRRIQCGKRAFSS